MVRTRCAPRSTRVFFGAGAAAPCVPGATARTSAPENAAIERTIKNVATGFRFIVMTSSVMSAVCMCAECNGVYGRAFLNLPYGFLKRTCTDPKKTLNAAILVGLRMIDAQLAAFLQEGVGIHIGTRDEARRPNGARAIAVQVEDGGAHLVVYVSAVAA